MRPIKIFNIMLPFLLLIAFPVTLSLPSRSFQSGQFYRITSAATGRAMTVDGNRFRSNDPDITTSPWISQDNQVWLALAEKPASSPEKFVLLPQRQPWGEWGEVLENGKISEKTGKIPGDAVVLTLDSSVVNLTQSVFNDSSSQKWVSMEAAEDGYVLIKNWGNQQCIKNFE